MRVAYELTGLQIDASGVARYVQALRDALAARPDVEVMAVSHPEGGPTGRIARGLDRELRWFPFGLGRAARATGADVLHCPGHVGPPRDPGLPFVMTIFDVMALEHPEWFTRANALHVRVVWPRIIRQADAVVVAAEFTRSRLLERLPWLPPDRVHAVPCGVEERFSPGPGPGRSAPYVLTVGRLQPRKGLDSALRAFEAVADRHPDHELLVVGARGWHDDELVDRLQASRFASRVHLLGRVSDDELIALYRGAACFLFPSRYEGFGFPPLEALACGAPVVSSSATTLPEVVGGAGLLVDPHDVPAMAGALDRVLGDAGLAADLRARGPERAREFSWARCAADTVAVYEAARSRVA